MAATREVAAATSPGLAAAGEAVGPPRRGRPPGGARERILEAATAVLKSEGFAGTTLSKVAESAGESKALITYHFGSKDGLVGAVGSELAQMITERVLAEIDGAATVEQIVRGVVSATEKLADDDERVPRLYFDLAAVSVVESGVRATMIEVNRRWQEVLEALLLDADDGPRAADVESLARLVIAGNQGLALERIDRGPDRELKRTRELFVRSVVLANEDLRGG